MEKLVDEMTNDEFRSTIQGLMDSVGGINVEDFCGKNNDDDVSGNKIGKSPNESKGDSFQDKIKITMEKLQNSSDQVDVSVY